MNRRGMVSVVLLCVGFSLAWILVPVAEAKCASPTITLNASRGGRGSTVIVKGELFWIRCNDVRFQGTLQPPVHEPAAKDIRILFKQGDQTTLLTTVDADANLRFSVTITVPPTANIGAAAFAAEADAYPRFTETAFGPRETIQSLTFEVIQ